MRSRGRRSLSCIRAGSRPGSPTLHTRPRCRNQTPPRRTTNESGIAVAERVHTILIVEDESLLRAALTEYLDGCGFDVREAANADEAIVLLSRSDMSIDIVFTDVQM